jgi:FtsP/CotA-like multicopper oxidase with cupredoxin domain
MTRDTIVREASRRCMRRLAATSLLLCLLGVPAAARSSPARLQPDGWDAGLRLREPVDMNPDPRTLEVSLEARLAQIEISPGQIVEAWTYDGALPGPLLRLRVGDRLIVHFRNALAEPTTVHWHGVRVPFAMDGVPGYSQPDVKPGESFTYDFVVPDAGLYWYHPHVMSHAQVGFGLYGALLVEDPDERARVGVADELVLVLSDIALEGGSLQSPDSGGDLGMVFGREGTHILVNGRTQPVLRVRAGAPQRWRIVNTSKSRYFDLDLPGTRFRQIGGDGGLQEYAVEREALVLAPGERADVIVTPPVTPGQSVVLRSVIVNRGFGSFEGRIPFDDLVTITAASDLPQLAPAPLPVVRQAIEPLPQSGATPVSLEMTLDQPPGGRPEYHLLGPLSPATHRTIRARVGETQIWTVRNSTAWSHPLHLHGYFFQVLDANGSPVRPLVWKDTVDIPFEQTVRLIVRFDPRVGGAGSWMLHCHILDHAEGGLMGMVEVGGVSNHDGVLPAHTTGRH